MGQELLRTCADAGELWEWVREHVGVEVPRVSFCENHCAPFEYLCSAYFESEKDLVVWGPRGGGKTRLAAIATLLDVLHRPGFSVRVLGGSMEQSLRVWEHLLPDLERLVPELLVKSRARSRRVELANQSSVAALAQSQRAVRGQRVQKLRCDEVEMFRAEVWEAAGATTKSLELNGQRVGGAIEALSTYHETTGLMADIVERAQGNGTRVLTWCVMDVMARCTREASACATCELRPECQGRARENRPDGTPWSQGFVAVEDVISIKRRVSKEMWNAEMLCRRPARKGRVFPYFSPAEHVADFDVREEVGDLLELGVDFGYRNPFVALFLKRGRDGRVYVVDEYVCREKTVREHVEAIRSRPWMVKEVACDPAGNSRNEQTGVTSVTVLKNAGLTVHSKASLIIAGIERIRAIVRPATGQPQLVIHPRCTTLIRALSDYRYDESSTSELPLKDGVHDHPIDALRYWLTNESGASLCGSKRGY